MCDDFGPSIDEIFTHGFEHAVPTERALCYRADQLDFVIEGYVSAVRIMQTMVACGPLRGQSTMFTRSYSLLDAVCGNSPPVEYLPATGLSERADDIWNPDNYRPLSSHEVQALLAGEELAEV